MTINKATGNMFRFLDGTFNPIAGDCPHNCGYCYGKEGFYESMDKYNGEPRLHEKSLNDDLSRYDSYFIGNMVDMFAEDVPDEAIERVLEFLNRWPDNTYLFLTKIPVRYMEFTKQMPPNSVLGTTIETNRYYENTNAPNSEDRVESMMNIYKPKMISIEPIMDFDMYPMMKMIRDVDPEFVSIGADSKGHDLDEPSQGDVLALIRKIQADRRNIPTHLKPNLKRIIGEMSKESLHQVVRLCDLEI